MLTFKQYLVESSNSTRMRNSLSSKPDLTRTQTKALHGYRDDQNDQNDASMDADTMKYHLHTAMHKNPLKHDVHLFRGIHPSMGERLPKTKVINYSESIFSTTRKPSIAYEFARGVARGNLDMDNACHQAGDSKGYHPLLKIHARKGTGHLHLAGHSNLDVHEEHEVILPPGHLHHVKSSTDHANKLVTHHVTYKADNKQPDKPKRAAYPY